MATAQARKRRSKKSTVDETDRRILELMRHDARISLTELSKTLHMSKSAVKYRLDRLVESGVIKSFFTLVDSSVYDLKLSVVFDLTVEPQIISEVAKKLAEYDEVLRIYELSNSPELHVHGLFKDNEQLEQFIRHKLYSIKGIRVIKSGMIMRRYKSDLSLSI